MCLFPTPNLNFKSIAYKKGIHEFDCGACPECLAKRARVWALRTVYETKRSPCCMITLTYDNYIHDSNGKIIGEQVANRSVDKRDCQLFMKRLRKYFKDKSIKYLITAEYGKHTHRPHYHALLFGVEFPDLVYYKKSKRGNVIYKSKVLERIWHNGICTVDAVHVTAQVARYCTKYCAKDARCDDTFMLVSRGIGEETLLQDFNGISYIIDGQEYPIPKQIWQKKISEWYLGCLPEFTYKYKSLRDVGEKEYYENCRMREAYRYHRDSTPDYQRYIQYWSNKAEVYERNRPSAFQRILSLPDQKYFSYKVAALKCYARRQKGVPAIAPRSGCKSAFFHWLDKNIPCLTELYRRMRDILPFLSCHERADDTMQSFFVSNSHFKATKNCSQLDFLWEDCPFPIDNCPIV